MKIRRSMIVLFVISTLIIPVSLYRSLYSSHASSEFFSTIDVISAVLMTVFVLLVFSFSLFTDDFPHAYAPRQSRGLGFVTLLLAGAEGYTAVLGFISDEFSAFSGTSGKVLSVLGMLSVLAFMFYAVTFFQGRNLIPSLSAAPILPALWYGLRMLLTFLRSASMADIRRELPVIAMCCGYTICLLTLGKLFCGVNSNSIKWGFAAGCVGVMTTFLYVLDWIVNDCHQVSDLLCAPTLLVDLLMAFFTVGTLFHVSAPSEYFEDDQWDDYYYENYDLPKPNLVLHTPVDELEEDSLLDDDFIPSGAGVGSRSGAYASDPSPRGGYDSAPQPVPSYIANPAAYYPPSAPVYPTAPQYPVYPAPAAQYPVYPAVPQYPAYPTYPSYGYPAAPVYPDPYDASAAQYQYDRRRAELQNRELEKLTGEVDSSIARLGNTAASYQPPSSEYVAASPDERIGGAQQPGGVNVRLNQGYVASGERLTDHLDRLEQENRSRAEQDYGEDEYTYEYYYPTDGSRYDLGQFGPRQ